MCVHEVNAFQGLSTKYACVSLRKRLSAVGCFEQCPPIPDNPTCSFTYKEVVQVIFRTCFDMGPRLPAIGRMDDCSAFSSAPSLQWGAKIDFAQRFTENATALPMPCLSTVVCVDDEAFSLFHKVLTRNNIYCITDCPPLCFRDEVNVV